MAIGMTSSILVVGLTAAILVLTLAEDLRAEEGKYRLGLQGAHFLAGLSGVMEISDEWAAQGIIDLGVDAFAFRLLNRFHQETYWNAYGEGTVGFWTDHNHRRWGRWDDDYNSGRSDIGLGVGIGIEYDWRKLDPSLPPIGWNIELGANVVPAVDLALGLGVHWKF